MTDLVTFLRTTDLFAGVSDSGLASIIDGMDRMELGAGKVVFEKGESGDAVYLIETGRLRLESDGVHLVSRGPGDCVGEFALIDDAPRSASAIVDAPVSLLRWGRERFQTALSEKPEIARGIFRILTAKLRQDISIHVDFAIEKERWRQDLQRAREIQMGMLPDGDVQSGRISASGFCRPAVEVGGDYYDFLTLGPDKLGIIVGDVTGHGFYSALFVAMAKTCLHTLTGVDHAPTSVMLAMRRTLSLSIQRRLLMSCCYAVLDAGGGVLSYANAGHPYPYHYRAATGRLERLYPLDPILGALEPETSSFHEAHTRWESGDVLVVYTDGITEGRNVDGHMFEHRRLEEIILRHAHSSTAELKYQILEAVRAHAAGSPQTDDLTLVVARSR